MIHEEAFTLDRPGSLVIRGESYAEGKPEKTVVICHGFKGFAHWGFFPHLARAIASAGMRAITFDFSGSGIGEDRETLTEPEAFRNNTFSLELADLKAVIQEARNREWITGGYGLFGHSRGGGIAILHAADNSDVKTLVTWSAISHTSRWDESAVASWRKLGYTDIPNVRTGETYQLGTALLDDVEQNGTTTLSIPAAAAKINIPWLIVHGGADETVPREEAERLHGISRASSTLRIIDGENHGYGARHPLTSVPPGLETATRETVNFYLQHLS